MAMDKFHAILLMILVVMVYLYYTKKTKQSGYSSVVPKPENGQCPTGYNPLYETLCAKP